MCIRFVFFPPALLLVIAVELVELYLIYLYFMNLIHFLLWWFVITSLNLTQRYMRDMFPWSMVNIWGRCQSNNRTLCLSCFINYKEFCGYSNTQIPHMNLDDDSRSGEWGDHVTLQAAADSVWIWPRVLFFFSFCWKEMS